MRAFRFAFLLIISLSVQNWAALADEYEGWRAAHKVALQSLLKCLQEQTLSALGSDASSQELLHLIGIMCRKDLALEQRGVIGALQTKGYSQQASEELSKKMQTDMLNAYLNKFIEMKKQRTVPGGAK